MTFDNDKIAQASETLLQSMVDSFTPYEAATILVMCLGHIIYSQNTNGLEQATRAVHEALDQAIDLSKKANEAEQATS